MGSLFRSEEMSLCQLFIQNEAAYSCISQLGEVGLVQFRDSNPGVNAFQRKYINQVRRCDEMLRKLCFVEKEIKRYDIREAEVEGNPAAPHPKELNELEAFFEKMEDNLREVSTNAEALKKTYLELIESKQILIKAKGFFEDQETATTPLENIDSTLVPNEVSSTPIQLGFITGVILRERLPIFETMLWRVCLGNVFMKQADMDQMVEDPVTGEQVRKVVFILFFQGERLKNRVKKICEGCRATIYPCPETFEEREKMLKDVKVRLEDLNEVLNQTNDHQHRLLVNASENIKTWVMKIRKVKAIYSTMNLFNLDVAKECLIAECWCANRNITSVQQVLRIATEESGSSVPSILNRMETKEAPPTYNVVNKFTSGFQNIVDAYGVASYREVNPAPYTIITFPFLFAVMFGDCGHGLLMLLFALWMVLTEKKWMNQKSDNEIWTTIFGGRYIVLLMGGFSIYTGLIYNDAYSLSLNIFGTTWRFNDTDLSGGEKSITIVPSNETFVGYSYPFGIDPVWQNAENKIVFLNSYKMKLSVVFGVSQMLFGVILSLWNHTYFRKPLNILCEFVPQILFLMSIFGYLVVLIFFKWIVYRADGSFCAPSLLITLINMFLFKYEKEPCYLDIMYDGQKTVQTILVAVAGICIPWMLLVKPLTIHYSKHKYVVTPSEHGEDEKSFGDLFIDQAIHTIEYCLGSISHTASYLRLWALSLAHAELSEVLWTMVMRMGLGMKSYAGAIAIYGIFAAWAVLTIGILLIMEGLSAFLHALRLHWVEFQSKFYRGEGYLFVPFSFETILEVELDLS